MYLLINRGLKLRTFQDTFTFVNELYRFTLVRPKYLLFSIKDTWKKMIIDCFKDNATKKSFIEISYVQLICY